MNTRNRLAAAVRCALPVLLLPALAIAQDEARQLERIEITGSRIKKAELEGQTPVQVITREQIERTGLTSIGDLLQQITASGSSLNTKFNSSGNFGFPPDGSGVGAGAATVDLRHLGPKRVLVLVDGIRWVNESSASGVGAATDLNTIPVGIIERIEVLEDGASSIYGSDAISGVINIITRRETNGAAVSVQYGAYGGDRGETSSVEASIGGSGERHSFFLGVSRSEQEEIASSVYDFSGVPVPGTGLTFGSSATPNGRFIFFPDTASSACPLTDLDDDPATPPVPFCNITTPNGQSFPNGPRYPEDFIGFGTPNRFNFAQFNLILTPNTRKSAFGQGRIELGDRTTAYVRTLFNNRQSANQAAPEPLFLGPDAGTGNPYADNILISASNPYNPFGIDLISSGPGANLVLVGRRPIEGGPRRFEQDVDTWYFGTGLEGSFDIGTRNLLWDLNYARSGNKAVQTNYGSYNIRRINLALGPLANCQADPQCVPLNIFGGPGTLTPEMLAYIQPIVTDRSENNLELISGNLSGDLFNLPAGAMAFAAGFEYRKLDGMYQPDALTTAGEYNGVPSLPTSGEYDVTEYYLELNAPIYAAGSSRLDLSVAGRYSDYSTFGGETTGKLGLRWQITDQFLLRGTFAEGFRAPSIGELFGSASRFDATLVDPCLISVSGAPPTADCSAFGVPAGATQANSQISVTTGGNPNLDPERVDSTSFGFVYSPAFGANAAWSERFDIEFSYYKHELEGAIQAIDAQTQLDLCVAAGPSSPLCEGITRASTGGINGFNNRLVNLGLIETDGFDVDLFWTLPETGFGQFRVSWQNTFVDDYTAVGANGVVQPRTVGLEVNDSAIPEWTSNLGLDWSYGNFSARWTTRFIDRLTEDCGDAVDFEVCRNPAPNSNPLGSTTYHDLQLGWKAQWLEGAQFTLGVNNVFEKQAPLCLSCSLNGYDASTYDLPERFIYGKVELKF
jgi:iron complex outermembrane receptor protein